MKKYKYLILLICVFMLSGCDATYTLTVTEDKMVESVSFLVDKSPENQKKVDQYSKNEYTAYYDLDTRKTYKYEKTAIEKKNKIGLNLKYAYLSDNLQKSTLLDECYYKKSVSKTDKTIHIFTDGITSCFYKDDVKNLDTLTVEIKTKLNVTVHNADKVKGDTYIWYITQENYKNKPIEILMEIPEHSEKESNWVLWLAGLLTVIFISGIIVVVFVLVKGKNNNKL